MDHNVNHKQTHADKDQQTAKKPKYTKTLWPLLGKSQQAYCKTINKDREKREKTFSQRQRSPSFNFLHYLKSVGIKWQTWWFWEMVDDDGGLRERLFDKGREADLGIKVWFGIFLYLHAKLVGEWRTCVGWESHVLKWVGPCVNKYHFISPSTTLAFLVSWVMERT